MIKAVGLLFALTLASAGAAQPKPGGCPTTQAETAHLYLKANGKDGPAKDAGGPNGGGVDGGGMAIDEVGMPIDYKKKKGKGIVVAPGGGTASAGQAEAARTGDCTVRPGRPGGK
jgi:hypothetical protein